MKLNKFAYLYSKPLGNHTLKINKKIPGNLLKNLEKSWKYHGIFLVRKSGNPAIDTMFNFDGDYKADIKCEQAFTSGKY